MVQVREHKTRTGMRRSPSRKGKASKTKQKRKSEQQRALRGFEGAPMPTPVEVRSEGSGEMRATPASREAVRNVSAVRQACAARLWPAAHRRASSATPTVLVRAGVLSSVALSAARWTDWLADRSRRRLSSPRGERSRSRLCYALRRAGRAAFLSCLHLALDNKQPRSGS
jgi:hypothetical protein